MLNGLLQWLAENEILGFNVDGPELTVCELAWCSANWPPNVFSNDSNVIPSRAKTSRMRPMTRRSFDCYCFECFLIASRLLPCMMVKCLNDPRLKSGSRAVLNDRRPMYPRMFKVHVWMLRCRMVLVQDWTNRLDVTKGMSA